MLVSQRRIRFVTCRALLLARSPRARLLKIFQIRLATPERRRGRGRRGDNDVRCIAIRNVSRSDMLLVSSRSPSRRLRSAGIADRRNHAYVNNLIAVLHLHGHHGSLTRAS